MSAPNFREYVRGRASWFDKIRCRVFGHVRGDWLGRIIERMSGLDSFCHRCGDDLAITDNGQT